MTIATVEIRALVAYRGWLARQADAIATETAATELGRRARRAYVDRQAVRNLLRCAETSATVSDLLDYVKVRIARHPQWRREAFGPTLLEQLEQLQARAGGEDVPTVSDYPAGPHLELCRLFLRHLAAAYAYSIAVDIAGPRGTASMPPRPPARPPAAPPVRRREGERRGRPAGEPAPPAAEQPAPTVPAEEAAADAVVEGAPSALEPTMEGVPATETGQEERAAPEQPTTAPLQEDAAAPATPADGPPQPTTEGAEPTEGSEPPAPEGEPPVAQAEAPAIPPKETTE